MVSPVQVEQILRRFSELESELAEAAADGEAMVRLAKEYAELTPVARQARELQESWREREDLREMAADPEGGEDMRALAEAELAEIKQRLEAAKPALQLLLLPKDAADDKSAILEIRAGTGGDEAALFAGDLLRMYQRYAEQHGWKLELINISETDLGGVKEVVANVTGRGAFARLKYESGVHRVQRIPETESGGRIHTSAATVAVLPEAEEVDVQIDDKDLKIDTFRAQGAGGQHVNKTDSAVRITHLPSGIVVSQQDDKSQHKNRAKAMKILRARLYEQEREQAHNERAETRREQIGSGDRSERIRTYNFPQGRVTDHRINLTLYKLDRMIAGEAVDEIIDALIADDQTRRLAALEGGRG